MLAQTDLNQIVLQLCMGIVSEYDKADTDYSDGGTDRCSSHNIAHTRSGGAGPAVGLPERGILVENVTVRAYGQG